MGKSILNAGLGRFTPSSAVDEVVQKVDNELEKAKAAGNDMTNLEIDPEDVSGSLDALRRTLKSNDFDAFIIGFGLRGMKNCTVLFEEMLNCARETRPGMKMLLTTRPDGIMEALERL